MATESKILAPNVGDSFEFSLEGGTVLVLEYHGRSQSCRQIWYEPATGATLDPLPPYLSFKKSPSDNH